MRYFFLILLIMAIGTIVRRFLDRSRATSASAPSVDRNVAAKEIPPTWGWAKVALASAQLKALGYYYRDKQAGPSFRVVVDLVDGMSEEAIRAAAHETGFRGGDIVRLGAHETVSVEGLPPDAAAMFAKGYERGHGVAGPSCAVVLKLTTDEKKKYGLPERPPFVDAYL